MEPRFLADDSEGQPNTKPVDRRSRRALLRSLLGEVPASRGPVGARKLREEERGDFVLETLELDLNGLEPVPAVFAKPKAARGPLPTILYNHSHGGRYDIGKRELIEGQSYLQRPPYAQALTNEGWAVLCFDTWVFGERHHSSELDVFKAMLWQGQILWGMMVHDSLRALDYLEDRADVDASRIATLGMSMGSTMAWWVAALDERVAVTVDICCLTDFHSLLQAGALELHGVYYYVPKLLKHFTTAEINALIAPRPHLALAGLRDELTPRSGLDRIDKELCEVYGRYGAQENWRLLRFDAGHEETADGRREVLAFLRTHLA